MAKISNKAYDALLTKLEQLADGTKKHADNVKIKAGLDETEIRNMKTELESLREAYIQNETAARIAYDVFAEKFALHKQTASNHTRTAKGALGPKTEMLSDFGITPEKSKVTKKAKAARLQKAA